MDEGAVFEQKHLPLLELDVVDILRHLGGFKLAGQDWQQLLEVVFFGCAERPTLESLKGQLRTCLLRVW